ncbi:MAG: 2,3-bisphosphoglycerate-independent phosphoglycerate mutase [Pseudomonadota bacterium]
MTHPKPVVLCILDGWGLREETAGNAPALAHTPNFDHLMATCPNATLITHGPDAGLPKGQMGNSEVGHTNIGAGRVVAMDLGRIDLAIENGSFFDNEALLSWIEAIKTKGGAAHLLGLMSDGGVHGHLSHMIAAAKACADAGLRVHIHALTDGRDVAPVSAAKYLEKLQNALPVEAGIATVSGRYYAMDRDNRWDRVEKAARAILHADGVRRAQPQTVLDTAAADGKTDEFIEPSVIEGYSGVQDGDGIFCLNFRADRAREIMAALADPKFNDFNPGQRPDWAGVLGMAEYSDQHNVYMETVYPKPTIVNTLGEWVAKQGLRQFRLAETEKYPHVTFFLNGGAEIPSKGEDRHMPKSPDVPTYDLQPEMSSSEVTDALVRAINERYDLIVVNYANPDMIGHTGDLDAAITACEAVDHGLGLALAALEAVGGAMIVAADHGNCETMIDLETGGAHTAHTLNLVPVIVVGATGKMRRGRLADLAPTVLGLMGLPKPDEMTGTTLLT